MVLRVGAEDHGLASSLSECDGVTEGNRTPPWRDLDEALLYNEHRSIACVDQLPHQGSRQRPLFRAR